MQHRISGVYHYSILTASEKKAPRGGGMLGSEQEKEINGN